MHCLQHDGGPQIKVIKHFSTTKTHPERVEKQRQQPILITVTERKQFFSCRLHCTDILILRKCLKSLHKNQQGPYWFRKHAGNKWINKLNWLEIEITLKLSLWHSLTDRCPKYLRRLLLPKLTTNQHPCVGVRWKETQGQEIWSLSTITTELPDSFCQQDTARFSCQQLGTNTVSEHRKRGSELLFT